MLPAWGASFPAEGFAQFREDGSHLQPFAEVKGFRPFLEGHVSHGCGKVFIQTGKSVAAPGAWTGTAGLAAGIGQAARGSGTAEISVHTAVIHILRDPF